MGKSLVAANLAVALAQADRRVTLLDADLGAANIHILFDLVRPSCSLSDFLQRGVETLDEVSLPTMVPQLSLIAGAGSIPGVANINYGQKLRLLRHIKKLQSDVVVIDIGAGTSYNVIDFFDAADLKLVVMTPQLTSMTNSYSFLKSSVFRVITRIAKEAGQQALVPDFKDIHEKDSVTSLIDSIWKADESLAFRLRAALDHFGVGLVANQLSSNKDLRMAYAISRMARDFLSLSVQLTGHLWSSALVSESINKRRPYVLSGGQDGNAKVFHHMAETLLGTNVRALRAGRNWSGEELVEAEPPHEQAAVAVPVADAQAPATTQTDQVEPQVETYLNSSKRYDVDWSARLTWGERCRFIRVKNVSMMGALIEGAIPLEVGDKGSISFDEVHNSPSVEIVIRNVKVEQQLFGTEFISAGEQTKGILSAALDAAADPDGD